MNNPTLPDPAFFDHASLDDLFNELAAGDLWVGNETDSSNDSHSSFTADCEFLLSTVFNPESAACLTSSADVSGVGAKALATPGAYSGSYSCEFSMPCAAYASEAPCGQRSFGSLFGQQPFSTGTPVQQHCTKQPTTLPPKPARRDRSDARGSSLKGVTKTVNRPGASDRAFSPFCVIKIGGQNGGKTLKDLNASIADMAKNAGMC